MSDTVTTSMATAEPVPAAGGRLGVRHALLVPVAPRRVFALAEDTGAYGLTLVVLLVLVMLAGVVQTKSGLIDREVEIALNGELAELESSRTDLVDRVELKQQMESRMKNAEFTRLIRKIGVIVAAPLSMLAFFLLVSSVFYAVVAMTGRKPEFHTLMSICVYAGVILLIGRLVQLAMMFAYRTTDIDTSLRPLGEGVSAAVLSGFDPFRTWFWVLMAIGLVVTRRLGRKMAVACCLVMWLLGSGLHVALAFAGQA